jgi:hypothetical protein
MYLGTYIHRYLTFCSWLYYYRYRFYRMITMIMTQIIPPSLGFFWGGDFILSKQIRFVLGTAGFLLSCFCFALRFFGTIRPR